MGLVETEIKTLRIDFTKPYKYVDAPYRASLELKIHDDKERTRYKRQWSQSNIQWCDLVKGRVRAISATGHMRELQFDPYRMDLYGYVDGYNDEWGSDYCGVLWKGDAPDEVRYVQAIHILTHASMARRVRPSDKDLDKLLSDYVNGMTRFINSIGVHAAQFSHALGAVGANMTIAAATASEINKALQNFRDVLGDGVDNSMQRMPQK